MRRRTPSSGRALPDGTPLQNRRLASLPTIEYERIARHLAAASCECYAVICGHFTRLGLVSTRASWIHWKHRPGRSSPPH